MSLRQLTRKNDPRLNVIIPQQLMEQIKTAAKSGKRPHTDEVIRRIGKTFEDGCAVEYRVQAWEAKIGLEDAIFDAKHIQRFPKEMLEALKESAHHEGHDMNMEVTLRLMATFQAPQAFIPQDTSKKVKNTRLTQAMIRAQKIQYIEASVHYYEREKLKLLLNFAGRLPKHIKESFQYIDVDTVGAKILDDLFREDCRNRESRKVEVKRRDWNVLKKRVKIIKPTNVKSGPA